LLYNLLRLIILSFPLLANLYLICTLLSTLFTLGDFNSVYFVSGGGPALSTHVLATLGIRNERAELRAAWPRSGRDRDLCPLPQLEQWYRIRRSRRVSSSSHLPPRHRQQHRLPGFLFGTAKHGVVKLLATAINDLGVIR
jgi:hypothetical protein